jgi:hypothetical protein
MYKKPETAEDLAGSIAELELIAARQRKEIQNTYEIVSDNLKPANLVKSGIRSVLSGTHNDDLMNILIGMGTGFLSRKLIIGKPRGFMGKTVAKALQWGMTGLVSKNAEAIKEKAGHIIDWIFKKHRKGDNHVPPKVDSGKASIPKVH